MARVNKRGSTYNKKVDNFALFKNKGKKKEEIIFERAEKAFPKKIKKILDEDLKKTLALEAAEEKQAVEVKKSERVRPVKEEITVPEIQESTLDVSGLPMKLNKFIAHCGVCSRRSAADLVKGGKVKVNGKWEINPSYEVQIGDKVEYENKVLGIEEKKVYLLMNKPKNTITSLSDEKGRKTVIDLIKSKIPERVYPVGRLDRETTGLLILTNDGDLAGTLAHPSSNVKKIYLAHLDKPITPNELEKIRDGLILEDGKADVDDAQYNDGKKNEVIITIHIGKNRIVRRIFEHLGCEVIKLDRLCYGALTKKDLPRGFFRPLTADEIIYLKHFSKGK